MSDKFVDPPIAYTPTPDVVVNKFNQWQPVLEWPDEPFWTYVAAFSFCTGLIFVGLFLGKLLG